ncbi:putative fatty acid synthase subunit alpha [Aspergillus clavatus NRRL 1]|uniref:Fatty acid synthase subunit alpha, putative n=1 Tax=Aspergillus clavatus (strain ATCC 1007 / CBS 513.65 / DSM 816 / NCTC 3887 / NRRL 1 / QM 1276 / 107) TaxID=344612 RepID=A1CFM7_ASPCL|nr:fatty acid synthase subunit alpha, putative [Aspergillus clavatus NRRL 1]EAW11676.1 fatty acid synthase subunit alpha, putative [Aspergillus clavatus NRRL 1]
MEVDMDSQRKLARTLLIELMAYQFASPVRWIETQDIILSRKECDKIVEVGPNSTLVGMFQRTLNTIYQTQECTRPEPRRLLNSERDTKEIYYETIPDSRKEQANDKKKEVTKQESQVAVKPEAVKQDAVSPDSVPRTAPRAPVQVDIGDEGVKAQDILLTVVSRALKKAPTDVDGTKSIKALAGGRSTLENEIIGDLHSEFGSLPDRAEDVPLTDVWTSIQSSHPGTLGKVSTAMINSLFTAKLPSNFTTAMARDQMRTQWGLQQGRQDSCLLLAVTLQPAARIATEAEAKAFIDRAVEGYAAKEGITLGPTGSQADSSGPGVVVDPEALREFSESQKALSRQLLDIYASHIGLDLGEDRRTLDALREDVQAKLQAELDVWTTEHGDDYGNGIRPRFDARKVRMYDSAWNWGRQSLLELFHLASSVQRGDNVTLDRNTVSQTCYGIANAAEETILPVLQEMMTELQNHTTLQSVFHKLEEDCRRSLQTGPLFKGAPAQLAPSTTIDAQGSLQYCEKERTVSSRFAALAMPTSQIAEPYLHFKEKHTHGWQYSRSLTSHLYDTLDRVEKDGESFAGQTVLLTGAGIGSIGAAMIRHFLQGGARVVTTTSSLSPEVAQKYQAIYMEHGARGSQLVVVPFNQASVQDVAALVEYIYSQNGLGWDLDYLVPFAAISEAGRKLDSIDSKSELAHRIMLTNVLRLLGTVKSYKEKHHYRSHPTQVVLPLSPNHGTFGGDGLYSESKLALETLFNRWHSEDWQDYLSICGAVIGWTRGTGLMSQNDLMAEGIEQAGMRTFSQDEMAYALVCLCTQTINELCQEQPLYADLTGQMGGVQRLPEKLQSLRQDLKDRSDIQAALVAESLFEQQCLTANTGIPSDAQLPSLQQKAHVRLDFPIALDYDRDIRPLHPDLQGMVDLHRVVVVTGFSELGPWGNARTRWEMEAQGKFSLEGAIEMAWLMGYIRHFTGIVDGQPYSGWVDSASKKPVADADVKQVYEDRILAHTGIRLIEPENCDGYNPSKKQFLHEVILQEDLEPVSVPQDLAEQLKLEHGEHADVQKSSTPDLYRVQLRKGAKLFIPRAMQFDRNVAGLVPTGWDARTYGIPEDIVTQVDRVTLFTLVCTVEALLSSGITDPYELYQYIHVSEVGTCIGSGFGGATALSKMYGGRRTGEEVQKDILQETFINTIGAWVNMLLLSASGPLRTPVGACATAIESLELGYETIVTGKAKFCLVGGCDDFTPEASYEFANMKATSNAHEEAAKGRAPSEMSRPATSTRSGFMESQGCGLQVLTTAELAVQMGLPIRGIVAFANTSSDKAGRSVPAPGKGVLTNAKHVTSKVPSPLMNIRNRRKRLEFRHRQIAEARDMALQDLDFEVASVVAQDPSVDVEAYVSERRRQIQADFLREERESRFTLGNDFWRNNPYIGPLAGALAVWGLTINDLDVASFHGTSTVLNDKNESSVIQKQLSSLGRREGNLILSIFQKYLTGHSKGAAGAWMLNGALQVLDSGIVPGNRNADNIDVALQEFDLIAYLQRPLHVQTLKAVSITSFGFGQKGAQAICVHPRYLFATLDREEYEGYMGRLVQRQKKADVYFYEGMNGNSLFRAKTAPPFVASEETAAYLDPTARFATLSLRSSA